MSTDPIDHAALVAHTIDRFTESAANFATLRDTMASRVVDVGTVLIDSFRAGGTAYFCGNGGSAADAQHLAAELMGRYLKDRAPLPAIALTTDTSALTAIGNDYGYDQVFSRQLRGVGRAGDVLVGISTSGNSKNVVNAFEVAKERGITTIALVGFAGGAMADAADHAICVPSTSTPRIQEMHILVGHTLCELIENALT